jgi:hypothetical protein
MKDVAVWYPDHNQFGGVTVSYSLGYVSPYSSYDEITYNPVTDLWDISDTSFYFEKDGSEYLFD